MQRSLRRAASLGLVSTIPFAAWAATGDARNNLQAVRNAASQQIRVAIVIPKSGPFSIHNRLLANGATLAANETETQGAGKARAPVHLKLKVLAVKPTANPKGILRSLARGRTRVLILPCNVGLQESLARAAAKAGLLTLAPCNPDSKLGTLSRYWPTGATGSAQVGQLVYYARYLYKQHAKRAFLLGAPHSWYAREMTPELRAAAKRNKVRIVGQASVRAGKSKSIGRIASRIRKLKAGVIFVAVPSPTVESIITQLRNWGLKSGVFVTDGMDAAINLKGYRNGPNNSSLENVVFSTFGFPKPGAAGAKFLRDYAAAYGKQPVGNFPGLGFETVRVLETAAQRAGALTPAGLNASFAKGFTVKGLALEDISYRGHGHRDPVTSVGLAQVIRDGYVAILTSVSGHPVG